MSMYVLCKEAERIREEEGSEAEKKFMHSAIGTEIGVGAGMITGAAAGSVVPVVGTFVGAVIGGVVGGMAGARNETTLDNVKTAAKGLFGAWRSPS
jgi:phage tail tape-measure protein